MVFLMEEGELFFTGREGVEGKKGEMVVACYFTGVTSASMCGPLRP